MRKLIIPISGKAMSGKDSVANIMKSKLNDLGYKTLIMHFADYLKFGCKQYLGWDGQKSEQGRTLLQQVGTEQMRNLYPNIWVESICQWINGSLHNYYDIFLIPDARFVNEVDMLWIFEWVFESFIIPVRVERKGFITPLTPEQQVHRSETDLDDYPFDYVISSYSGLDKLEQATDEFIKYLKRYYLDAC